MNFIRLAFLYLFMIFLLISCAADGGGGSIGNSTSGGLFVSKEKGSDSGDGTMEKPYKTISYALSQIKDGTTIYVAGGNYTSENDENFPLNLDIGVKIIKWSDENNNAVVINGFDSDNEGNLVTMILNGDNQLSSLTLDSNNNIAILSKDGNNEIFSCLMINNKVGIGALNDSKITLRETLINNNSHAGIEVSGQSIINMTSSKINDNNIGIILSDNSKIEFEDNESSQNNEIMRNTQCDFFHEGQNDLQLQNIEWDDNVFNFSVKQNCINGNNIVNIGSATINYQYIPSQNDTIFSTNKIINIISPDFGDTIFSTTPDFSYNAYGNKHIMIALWNKPPIVKDNLISNKEDIIWFWHTGMNNSPIGYVQYNNGSTPINGDINPPIDAFNTPDPLEHGRAYYFAIWEWNESGIDIIGSSNISYFIVSP